MPTDPIIITRPQCSIDQVRLSPHQRENISSILITGGFIRDRIKKLADEVSEEYHNKNLHMIYVLDGAMQFFSDLQHYIEDSNSEYKNPFTFNPIRVKSYENDKSTGEITIIGSELENIANKDVLVVEDIIDTGNTIAGKNYEEDKEITGGLLGHLKQYNPSSIKTISLTIKDNPDSNGYKPDFAGFVIPNKFIIGYGLDYNNHFRELRHLCIISDSAKEKYAKK